ncbi:MAG: circadian clock KaiB family protein [Rhodoplanes sp.]
MNRVRPRRPAISRSGGIFVSMSRASGRSPSRRLRTLKRLCGQHVPGRYSIELVDFLEPQLAKGDEIIAIPTLVRKTAQPIRKIVGDLSNEKKHR